MNKNVSAIIMTGSLLAAAPAAWAADYLYKNLDNPDALPGSTYPAGINNHRQIVGHYGQNLASHGFLYSVGTYTTMDKPYTNFGTMLTGLNNNGTVIGQYLEGTRVTTSALYDGTAYTYLEGPVHYYVGCSACAYGINDHGQVVGNYDYQHPNSHGFIYSNGIYTDFDNPDATAGGTHPTGINNSGQVVGYYLDVGNLSHGFLYSGGTFSTLDKPDAIPSTTRPTGINNHGQVSGYYNDATGTHGFVYSDGAYTTLDAFASQKTRANGINDYGEVVGDYENGQGTHGFLATPAETLSVELSAAPKAIPYRGSTTVAWSAANAVSCHATASDGWSGPVPVSGNRVVTLTATKSYGLTCAGNDGTSGQSLTVTVTVEPAWKECLFDWAEATYGLLFYPPKAVSQVRPPYTYRYYGGTRAYVGVSSDDHHVYYQNADGVLQDVGDASAWLTRAGCQ